jgi:spore coat assembly protein
MEGDYVAEVKVGDIVGRKSYDCDILFRVAEIKKEPEGNIITLKGISYRIEADAPENDLIQTKQIQKNVIRFVDIHTAAK